MRTNFSIKEISQIHEICFECADHICNWGSLDLIYCLKHRTDSPVFLVDKCSKLEQFRAAPQEQ